MKIWCLWCWQLCHETPCHVIVCFLILFSKNAALCNDPLVDRTTAAALLAALQQPTQQLTKIPKTKVAIASLVGATPDTHLCVASQQQHTWQQVLNRQKYCFSVVEGEHHPKALLSGVTDTSSTDLCHSTLKEFSTVESNFTCPVAPLGCQPLSGNCLVSHGSEQSWLRHCDTLASTRNQSLPAADVWL